MGSQLRKEPVLSKMKAIAHRRYSTRGRCFPQGQQEESRCVSSCNSAAENYGRKKPFLIFTLGREPEVCSWTFWLCLVSVMMIQGQCQALLETEENDKAVFSWVLWQHQSPSSAGAKVHVCWGCTSLSPTVGAASPLIPALPHARPSLGSFSAQQSCFQVRYGPCLLGV